MRTLYGYAGLFVGVAITAFALAFFLIPNRIAAGGVSGLATVLFHLINSPVGVTMLVLNIPLFLLSLKVIGAVFGVKTLLGTVLLSVLVDLAQPIAVPMTTDPLLASIYGGVIAGIGLGLAFRFGGSTGGTDMAAQLLARFFPTTVGQALLVVDGFVIVLAGFVFGPELALYALLAVFLTTKAIDVVQEGQSYARAAFIVSPQASAISRAVSDQLNRGATILTGRGAFTGHDKEVLFVIVARSELARLRQIVLENDPAAFFVITEAHEVLGEGFKRL